jgi:hypothetical protein
MGILGWSELFILFVLVGVLSLAFRRRGGAIGPTLVLRKFNVPASGSGPIEIIGRASGFVAWLLTTLGVDTETTLTVTEREVLFRGTSLSGISYQVVPLQDVSSTHCSYRQPIWLLVLGGVFVASGLFSAAFLRGGTEAFAGGIILGAVCAVVYVLQKKIAISVESSGGIMLGLAFKRSVIENVSVDMRQGMQAIDAINQRVMALKISRTTRVVGSPA